MKIVPNTRSGSPVAADRPTCTITPARAVPATAPKDRASETEAEAMPSRGIPASVWTVICTTPMIVPKQTETPMNTSEMCQSDSPPRLSAMNSSSAAAPIRPTDGYIVVRPLRLIRRR